MSRFPQLHDPNAYARPQVRLRRHTIFRAWLCCPASLLTLAFACVQAHAEDGKLSTAFPVKYVTSDSVYLIGGSKAGLAEGQKLTIRRPGTDTKGEKEAPVAEVEIESVALVSAVARITSSSSQVVAGDVAFLSSEDAERLAALRASEEINKYPQVVSFSEGNPPEQEARDTVPRPPSPEVNRVRGRFGLDFSDLSEPSGISSWQFGYVLRIDATRLFNTYWKLSGFYRGRVWSQSSVSPQTTMRDLINRTYHLSLSYDNPGSPWVVGIGRLYVPWATSLSTIDGAYGGRRWGKATIGGFGGTTPDPTSWNYNQHRQLFGGFFNYSGGSFESLRYSSTSGLAVSRISWDPDRQFGFFENNLFYKRFVSVYSNIEADLRSASQNGSGQSDVTFSRSFVSVRLQPHKVITFDLNENYFRNIPTPDVSLVGTGLLDQYLFQGVSGGARLALPLQIGVYGSLGRSSRTADPRASWNFLYGVSGSNILRTGIRAEFRYSRFDSSFGRGSYKTFMVSRDLGESFRFDVQAGHQNMLSAFTSQSNAGFVNGEVDWLWRRSIVLGAGFAVYRGDVQDYNQYYLTVGYRFDFHR